MHAFHLQKNILVFLFVFIFYYGSLRRLLFDVFESFTLVYTEINQKRDQELIIRVAQMRRSTWGQEQIVTNRQKPLFALDEFKQQVIFPL